MRDCDIVVKAVIPAAGLGTRMLPATKAVPKELLPVAGKPLIQYAVEEAVASGIETIVVVIRDGNSLIQRHFCSDQAKECLLHRRGATRTLDCLQNLVERVNLCYVEQSEAQGLAHALSCARPLLGDEPFVVLLPDVLMVSKEPVTKQLMQAYSQLGGSIIAVREVAPEDVGRFGIVNVDKSSPRVVDEALPLVGLLEKPSQQQAPSDIGVFGRYLLQPSIWEAIAEVHPDFRGELQLTDALNVLCQQASVFGVRFAGRHYDAGDRDGYLQANIELALEDPDMRAPLLRYLSTIVD